MCIRDSFSIVRGDTPALATAARSSAAAAPSRPHRWSPRHSLPPFLSPSPAAAVRSARMAREAAASPRARGPVPSLALAPLNIRPQGREHVHE
eukprot:12397434-Alexandrium_andersonii.AAC.1